MSLVRRTGSQFESRPCHLLAGSSGANHSAQPASVSSPARWSHCLPLPQRPAQSCTPHVDRSSALRPHPLPVGLFAREAFSGLPRADLFPNLQLLISSKVGAACCSWLWGWLSLAPFRTENTGGRLGKVRRISRRWGHST